MDYKKMAEAIKMCGSTPKVDQCKRCVYWSGGDMSECIPRMTEDAATAITDLLSRAEEAEAANNQLDGTVSTLMESNERLAEELRAHLETNLSKAHEALSLDLAKQKTRADEAEARFAALDEARENANEACAKWEGMYCMALERAEKAEKCIDSIEDDLDRGNDNDWAREHIREYRMEKEE